MHILMFVCDRCAVEMCIKKHLPTDMRFAIDSTKLICFGPVSIMVSHSGLSRAIAMPIELFSAISDQKTIQSVLLRPVKFGNKDVSVLYP